jgi:hypothetical protein
MGLIEILWTVAGVTVPLLLGTAWAMIGLSPPELLIARVCVAIAAAVFIGVALVWLVMMDWPTPARALVASILGALSLLIFSESFRLINAREALLIAQAEAVPDKRAAIRTRLQQFYIVGGQILDANIPKDILPADFKKYEELGDSWTTETANWIGENIGLAARAKFLDRSSAPFLIYDRKVNDTHNNIINALVAYRKNLSTLIETSAWDK